MGDDDYGCKTSFYSRVMAEKERVQKQKVAEEHARLEILAEKIEECVRREESYADGVDEAPVAVVSQDLQQVINNLRINGPRAVVEISNQELLQGVRDRWKTSTASPTA